MREFLIIIRSLANRTTIGRERRGFQKDDI